jgi:hypothetical protein
MAAKSVTPIVAVALFVPSATLVAVTVTTPAEFGATYVAAAVLCALKLPLDAVHVTPALPTSFVTVAVNGIACEIVNPPLLGPIVTLMLPADAAVVALAVFEYPLLFPAASFARTR